MLQWFTSPFIKSRQPLVGRSGTVHGIPPLVLGSRVKQRWRLGIECSGVHMGREGYCKYDSEPSERSNSNQRSTDRTSQLLLEMQSDFDHFSKGIIRYISKVCTRNFLC